MTRTDFKSIYTKLKKTLDSKVYVLSNSIYMILYEVEVHTFIHKGIVELGSGSVLEQVQVIGFRSQQWGKKKKTWH